MQHVKVRPLDLFAALPGGGGAKAKQKNSTFQRYTLYDLNLGEKMTC